MKQIWHDFRIGTAYKLLNWVLIVFPEAYRLRLLFVMPYIAGEDWKAAENYHAAKGVIE